MSIDTAGGQIKTKKSNRFLPFRKNSNTQLKGYISSNEKNESTRSSLPSRTTEFGKKSSRNDIQMHLPAHWSIDARERKVKNNDELINLMVVLLVFSILLLPPQFTMQSCLENIESAVFVVMSHWSDIISKL